MSGAGLLARHDLMRRSIIGLTLAALVALLSLVGIRPAAAANPCGPPVVSVIACENSLPGDPPSDWDVSGIGDSTIQGFATQMSVNAGQTINFKINTPAKAYHLDILRLGYYQGNGARKIASGLLPTATLPQSQPSCLNDTQATGLIDCGNWAVSASWTVPSNAVSGVYIAHLVRNDTGGSSLIPFVVRNDASHSDILFQTSDETWQAYNTWGGNSLYQCTVNCPPGNPEAYKGAAKVSYNRPWHSALDDNGASWLFYAEIPMIRFMEANGYDVSYTSGLDVSQPGYASTIEQHKVFMSTGHDEYWSGQQRANVEAARNAGVNLAFFSGNEVFWKTRWEPSIDSSSTPNRTLVAYKETHYDAPTDPQDPPTWTGTWMDPRFSPPADGGQPQNALTGQLFTVNAGTTDITVPSTYDKLRFWRNTRVASLASGTSTTLDSGTGTLGYEWDVDADNGFRPAGLFDMSSTTDATAQPFTDYGSQVTTAPTTHHLTLYRAPSGALVFGAGTVQWSWGLDNSNPSGKVDTAMQQATVNLFADMGAQPFSLISGLTPATASTDTTPPTSAITSPAQGASLSDGSAVTINGTATDSGGGVVAGVEVSTDGGTTWHPATTMSAANTSVTWSYSWTAHGNPTTAIESRAVDDSGNLEKPGPGVTVNVNCPCSIWGTNVTPVTKDSGDATGIEAGVKFQSDKFGTITGIRFYKASTNTGTHIGNLWTAGGQLLASATFTNETTSGWQQVNFSQPVPINPNTTYVASYFAPKGHESEDDNYFYTAPAMGSPLSMVNSPPLRALQNSGSITNGVFTYSSNSTFPTSTFGAANFYVDPVFTAQGPPGPVTSVTATAGFASANVSWTAPTTGGPVTTYTVTPYVGGVAQTPTVVSGSPAPTSTAVAGLTNGTTYTFTVTASNPAGPAAESPPSNAVTPSSSLPIVQNGGFESALSSWTAGGQAPPVASTAKAHSGTGSALLGTLSGSEPNGDSTLAQTIAVPSQGTSTLSFWYNPATTDDVCSGSACKFDWEEAQIRSTTGQTLASVFKSNSNSQAWTQASIDLTPYAGQSVVLWFNVHQDGSVPADDSSMYLDDVTVSNSQPQVPGAPTGVTATAGNGQATVSWTAPASSGGSAITSYTVTPYIGSTAQSPVTVSGSPPATTTTVTGLTNGTAYTFKVSATNSVGTGPQSAASNSVTPTAPQAPGAPTGVTATAGNGQATVSWTAPSSNGGSAITSYTVTPYIGSTAQSPVTVSGSPPATTTTVTGLTNGTAYTFTVSATNSVGTGPASSPSNSVTPSGPACPCSIWNNATPQGASDASDTSGVNLGVQFQASSDGMISGVRFYKESDNTGTHVGSLWTSTGTLLATGTFSGESASGWQELDFSSPVAITAGTTYVASYHTNTGHYAVTSNGLSSAVTNGPLTALASGGVYAYGSGNAFPNSTFNASNYWVDVVYSQTSGSTPPTVTTVTPAAGSTGNPVSVAPTATFSQTVVPSTVSFTVKDSGGTNVPGTVSFNSGNTVATFTPSSSLTNGTTYTATVSGAQNTSGTPMSSPFTWNFSTAAAATCPCSIWQNATPSGASDAADTSAVNLGVQFRASASGKIIGVRFYKESDNTGTHVGSLWTASGTLLATGTFSGESASGWQELDFSSPVAITAGTTYVASYHTNTGHYAFTSGGLSSAVTNGPLTALAGGGVYAYGSGNAFPSNSFNNANYWVDVVYSQSSSGTPPTVTSHTPDSGSAGNPVSVAPTATFSQAVVPSTVSFTVKDSGGTSVAGTLSFNGTNTLATFTPSSPLAADTTYTATVSGAQNSSGTPMSGPVSWAFSTASSQCPCSIWPDSAQPSVASANDTSSVNLGVKFTADTTGWIAGIRFYKGAGNTGTHVGGLWTASGTLLGQVTFTHESASGWQEADFSSPIAVTAGTTYVASYLAPSGGYSYDSGAFATTGVDNPPLHALASPASGGNGVYAYGGAPAFPSSSFNATNYWVDVVFTKP
jgi:N,N-dimethylformamidase beta subunit-like protein/uncharacterized protein DUF4082/Big-like domain-containing protein/fibronectin type III domain protein